MSELNDLFISYSHIDNQPWGAGQRRWVSELHKELTTRLEQLLGRTVRVWRDEKLRGSDELDERIISELQNATGFVCVISPRYLRSDWCVRELDGFLQRRKGLGSKGLVFKVVKTPVDRAQQPKEVEKLIGYDFFHETTSGKVQEFHPSRAEDSPEGRYFWQKLDDLAQEIKLALEDDREEPGNPDRRTVYLAETTRDVKLAREAIRRELGQHGYRVIPEREFPLGVDELLPLIESDLKQACLTVHPVGARYGFIPEGDDRSVVELQIEAATRNNGHAHHVIWVPPEAVPPSEDRQKDFIEKVRRVYTERPGTELLERKPLEELKTRLAEKLAAPKASARNIPRGLRLYLICDVADMQAVKPIEQYLRAQGFTVSLPLVEGSQEEISGDHRDTLVHCDAVLVYYGNARQAWLRSKQRDLWQARGWGRTRKMLGQAVFVAHPNTPEQAQSVADDFFLLGGQIEFRPEDLAPFVGQIQAAVGEVL